MKWKTHDLNHDLTFSAHTINFVCHSIRSMFRVLGIYNFEHSHKQGRKVQKLEYEKGRNHDYLCAKYQKQFPLNNAFKVLLIKSLGVIISWNLSLAWCLNLLCTNFVNRFQPLQGPGNNLCWFGSVQWSSLELGM